MRNVRAIAAAIVAVCICNGSQSLSAQPVAREPKQIGEPVLSPAQPPPESLQSSVAQAIKSSIGHRVGDPNFDPKADLNVDGVVNALDVAMFRLGQTTPAGSSDVRTGTPQATNGTTATITGERVIVGGQTTIALPGQTVSVLFLIRNNTTPILSYTVDANAVAQAGAVGTVTGNVAMTNFYDPRNIFTAGGVMRDPLFSFIEDNGSGGVSVTTITANLSTVLAVDNVNDVLAQVFFDVPQDALGDFTIALGSASILVDGNAAPIPFAFTPGTIHVTTSIPAVSEWGMIVLSLLILAAGSVVFAKRMVLQDGRRDNAEGPWGRVVVLLGGKDDSSRAIGHVMSDLRNVQ
jgi:hypothetical protein